jgi:pre-mRNA-splicing factor RBM22/SLT11
MLDLSFGLPITIRDAALKMVAPGPTSDVNREYFAQNNEKEIEEGRGLEGYEKTDEKARDLLRRLAASEPYYKKQRRLEQEGEGQKMLEGGEGAEGVEGASSFGPIRTADSRKSAYGSSYASPKGNTPAARGGKAGARSGRSFPSAAALPPKPADILPPADTNITSLFITGVEDDMPEHEIRTYFTQFGALRSLVCSHRSHCAFVNYMERASAEKAAAACQGRALVKGVPLRVQWGRPKPLDSMDRDVRMENARSGRSTQGSKPTAGSQAQRAMAESSSAGAAAAIAPAENLDSLLVAAPPGADDRQYAAQNGE